MDEQYQNFPKDLFYQIVNNTQECHFWKDKERRFVGVNQAFLNFYGFESQDILIGKTDEEMNWHPDPEDYRTAEERVLAGEDTYMVPGQCMVRGEVHDIFASKHPIYNEAGEVVGLYGSFIDATDEIQLSRQVTQLNLDLEHALKDARKTNKMLGSFLSRASHEIRTPLHAIIGLSEIGIKNNDPQVALEYLTKIASSGYYLLDIINDILDINKIESGSMLMNPMPTLLGKVFTELEDIVLPLMVEKELSYETDWNNMQEVYVKMDGKRLTQVLLNLFSNAIKYTPMGGKITFSCRQVFMDEGVTPAIYFAVEDTGSGISKEFIDRVFEPFSQEQQYNKQENSGTGLGLTIAKNFVDLMGGELRVDSTLGLGSKFYFSIPAIFCAAEEIQEVEDEQMLAEVSEMVLDGLRVLYVEDNQINREIGTAMLEGAGMTVEVCSDGDVALEMVRRSSPYYYDVILMDIQMPRMNGLECCRRIRGMHREDVVSMPVLGLTADVSDATYAKAIEAGMNNCMTKPVDIHQLYADIQKSLQE
ncbi:MAG: response regulator [Lachnospiraceae bacterium]|nr:response regulator [Lachnospiraceae bacterium]